MENLERNNEMKNVFEGVGSIEEETFTVGGRGGSGKDTDNSGVRLRVEIIDANLFARLKELHPSAATKEGELLVEAKRERKQHLNRKDAYRRLEERLAEARKIPEKRIETKPTRSSIEKRRKAKARKKEVKSLRKGVGREEFEE